MIKLIKDILWGRAIMKKSYIFSRRLGLWCHDVEPSLCHKGLKSFFDIPDSTTRIELVYSTEPLEEDFYVRYFMRGLKVWDTNPILHRSPVSRHSTPHAFRDRRGFYVQCFLLN